MTLHRGLLLSGFTMPACEQHFHDHDETWLILAGRGNAFLIDHDGRREDVDLQAGDVLMIPAGYEHGSEGPNTFAMAAFNGTLAEGAHEPGHYYLEHERYVPSLSLRRHPSDRYPPGVRMRRDPGPEGGGLVGRTVVVHGAPGRLFDEVSAALRVAGAKVVAELGDAESFDALVSLDASGSSHAVVAAFAAGKPVAALGDGLRPLLAAQVLGARTVAAPEHLQAAVTAAGATTGPMSVCTDTGLVTAGDDDAFDGWLSKVVEVFGEGSHPWMSRSVPPAV